MVVDATSSPRTPRTPRTIKFMGAEKSYSGGTEAPPLSTRPSAAVDVKVSKDAAQVIGEFDSKLQEINRMLAQYKEAASKQASGLGATGAAPGRAAASAGEGGQRRVRGAARELTEEEAYKNANIQRRVVSAGAGASRELTERIEMYRKDAAARVELQRRVDAIVKEREEKAATKVAASTSSINFVKSNKQSLMSSPEPYFSTVFSQRPASSWGLSSFGDTATHSRFSTVWAASASTSRPATSGGSSMFRMSAPSGFSSRPTTAGGSQQQQHLTGGGFLLANGSGKLGAPGSIGGSAQRYNIADDSTDAVTSISIEPSTPLHASSRGSGRPSRGSASRNIDLRASAPAGFLSSALAAANSPRTTHSTQSTRPSTALLSTVRPSTARSTSPELSAAQRSLRLVLTSRPATGGSPTRREDFLGERQVASELKKEHAEEVRIRCAEVQQEMQERRVWTAERKEKRREEELIRKAEEEAERERVERYRTWAGITALSTRLNFIVRMLADDRAHRPIREQRKVAAMFIAAWYKGILLRRRQQELVNLIRRIKHVVHPLIEAKKEQIRQRCADRIVLFLQTAENNHAAIAVYTVKRFLDSVRKLQAHWRVAVMVRRTQRQMLYNYFTRFERAIITRNHKSLQQAEVVAKYTHNPDRPRRVGAAQQQQQLAPRPPSPRKLATVNTMNRSMSPIRPGAATLFGVGELAHNLLAGQIVGSGAKKVAEIEDPELEAQLSLHIDALPKELRQQLTDQAVLTERRKFYRMMDKYRAEMQLYRTQRPMEELRLKLLREAGLDVVDTMRPPLRPHMHVLLSRSKLKQLLKQGMDIVKQQRLAASMARREEVEEALAVAAVSGAGSPHRAGGGHQGAAPSPKRAASPVTKLQ